LGWGFGFWVLGQNPQTQIPNPQSPIPIKLRKKLCNKFYLDIKNNKNNFHI